MVGDKLFYRTLLSDIMSDTFEIQYPDSTTEKFGDNEPKFKIIINEYIPKSHILSDPSMALGEAYMDKKIDICGSVQDVIESLYKNEKSFLKKGVKYSHLLDKISHDENNSKKMISHHYDIGNDFYKLWLDKSMTYSCAYFKDKNDTLEQAQQNKINHILKKLCLKEGMTLLDIGCGWGNLIMTAAKEYKVKATGITLSKEQYEKVKTIIKENNLEDLVSVRLEDYRELKKLKFDRIVSVGMLEHVGEKNLSEYFEVVNELLNDKGVSLVHSITGKDKGGHNTWLEKYIFPGGYVPGISELIECISKENFEILDVENLRRHYQKTVEMWSHNFTKESAKIRDYKDERFMRMWHLYLEACAASFSCSNICIHQILFTKGINNDLPWTREYLYK